MSEEGRDGKSAGFEVCGERRRYSGSYRTSPRQLFIIRVKREVKRPYRNGRYNERLNTETGGSKT